MNLLAFSALQQQLAKTFFSNLTDKTVFQLALIYVPLFTSEDYYFSMYLFILYIIFYELSVYLLWSWCFYKFKCTLCR